VSSQQRSVEWSTGVNSNRQGVDTDFHRTSLELEWKVKWTSKAESESKDWVNAFEWSRLERCELSKWVQARRVNGMSARSEDSRVTSEWRWWGEQSHSSIMRNWVSTALELSNAVSMIFPLESWSPLSRILPHFILPLSSIYLILLSPILAEPSL
jgi:hypothetical protein